jgi:DNA-directed RNA polymerase
MTFTDAERNERQKAFEELRQLRAVQKYQRDLRKMRYDMDGGYLSGTTAGRAATRGLFKLLKPHLEKFMATEGARYRRAEKAEAILVIKLLGLETTLGICVKGFLDALGTMSGDQYLRHSLVCGSVGSRLKTEFYRLSWEKLDPAGVQWLEHKYKDAGVWHKLRAAKTILGKKTGVTVAELNVEVANVCFTLAAFFILGLISRHAGWFRLFKKNVSKRKTVSFVKLTASFEEWYQECNEEVEQELQQAYPMLCKPRDWTSEGTDGGYLNPVRRYTQLLKDVKGGGSTICQKQLDFVNGPLQSTVYELNPFIFDVQNTLFGTPGAVVGSFKPISYHPHTNDTMPDWIQALPTDHEARVAWRKEQAAIHVANNESRKQGVRTVRNISAGRELIKEDKLWIPWSLGHNGRAYPLSAGAISPQGSDAERTLLRFHDGAEVTPRAEYWLGIHLANCYGISESHEAKAKWVEDHTELITAIATEPLSYITEWEQADEPWAFLAACEEYYACVLTKQRSETKLIVFNDATASGLQLLALLSRDKETAKKVNLIPGYAEKQDIYAALLPLVKAKLVEYGRPDLADLHIPRKTLKLNLVTRIYGSVLRSRRSAIRKTILEAYNFQKDLLQPGDANIMALAFEEAMQQLAPGALQMFDSLAHIGRSAGAQGKPARWTTPLGNKVVIRPQRHATTKYVLGWYGTITLADDQNHQAILDRRKVATSTPPLLIHSLDAASLAEAYHNWTKPLVTVHDCIGCRSTDCDEALDRILNAYITVTDDPESWLKRVAKDNGLKDYKPPILNTLTESDVDRIADCKYAFC